MLNMVAVRNGSQAFWFKELIATFNYFHVQTPVESNFCYCVSPFI